MLGSIKNSSSARSPNFSQRKLKMLKIEFRFDRKMRPSMESHPSLPLLIDNQKVRSPRFCSCTIYSFQVALIPC